jgi:hypothetical protein
MVFGSSRFSRWMRRHRLILGEWRGARTKEVRGKGVRKRGIYYHDGDTS